MSKLGWLKILAEMINKWEFTNLLTIALDWYLYFFWLFEVHFGSIPLASKFVAFVNQKSSITDCQSFSNFEITGGKPFALDFSIRYFHNA